MLTGERRVGPRRSGVITGEFVVVAVVIGLLARWLADVVVQGEGYGVVGDILLGIGGSITGVWIFRALGFAPNDGWMAVVGAAFVGAVALIYTQRMPTTVAWLPTLAGVSLAETDPEADARSGHPRG